MTGGLNTKLKETDIATTLLARDSHGVPNQAFNLVINKMENTNE